MSVPSMVHRSGDTLIVRSVVSGDALYGSAIDNDDSKANHQEDKFKYEAKFGTNFDRTTKDLPECKVKRNYSCNTCDFFTQNPRNFLYHLRDVHEEKVRIYECPNCLYASKHFQKLLRHTKMVHGSSNSDDSIIKTRKRSIAGGGPTSSTLNEDDDELASIAGTTTTTTTTQPNDCIGVGDDYMDDGLEEPNGERLTTVFKCSVCAFTARSRSQLNRHEREEHIKTKFFRCLKCTYVTHMKARFTKHVKYHSMPMIKCDMCDFRTPYKWNLDRHCKNHNGRGAFRCSACNFTADIKQSLTVHEMNHHIPPVGQAAGLGVGRRRNKVGASDSTAAEDAVIVSGNRQQDDDDEQQQVTTTSTTTSCNKTDYESNDTTNKKIKKFDLVTKKLKNYEKTTNTSKSFGSDFIHPDDIIHHANGNVYIKNKCKLCNFKSAWTGEMAKHEKKVHNIVRESTAPVITKTKKSSRPIPNLIPIPSQTSVLKIPTTTHRSKKLITTTANDEIIITEPVMSQQDIQDICAKSANSSLKDFASLFGSEDVFKNISPTTSTIETTTTSGGGGGVGGGGANQQVGSRVPDLIPASVYATSTPVKPPKQTANVNSFKQKNASFFDKLKEKLMTTNGANDDDVNNLICKFCGYESKCLTEQVKHLKICGTEINNQLLNKLKTTYNTSSSRCQFCRQRCKSSVDLYNHLKTCLEALKQQQQVGGGDEEEQEEEEEEIITDDDDELGELKIDESQSELDENELNNNNNKPHPMENRVFVWNNIEVPMDLEIDDSNYEYTIDDKVDDNISLDLSIRTQSPPSCYGGGGGTLNGDNLSENSFILDYNNLNTKQQQQQQQNHSIPTTSNDKIPTHGNDISIAQHKRVFKCPHCSFWASTASRFHVHIVGHLNKKPFECSLCSYRSNWRWDITKHIKLKSVRDPAHENAKVLMTDETGRRNYTKYNKYLTEIHVTSGQNMETSGGSGTRHQRITTSNHSLSNNNNIKSDLPKLTRAPTSRDFSPLLKTNSTTLRPPPPLKAADGIFFAEKKRSTTTNAENKRTLFKCKKCNFRDASRDVLLAHVKGHYPQTSGTTTTTTLSASNATNEMNLLKGSSPENDEASVNVMSAKGSQAPFRCGHCNQVSNWKHVIQRHCRLKHSGDIRVVSNKNGQEKLEMDEQMDEPDHLDIEQDGTFKCNSCPFSNNNHIEFEQHLTGHLPNSNSIMKCYFCKYYVTQKDDLLQHLKLHGIQQQQDNNINEDILNKILLERGSILLDTNDTNKRFKCLICPYVTNSKSQYTYHKQFHKPRGGQYTCTQCSYNVSKRHLLHQHLKVHGINTTPPPLQQQQQHKLSIQQTNDVIDLELDEMTEDIEEVVSTTTTNSLVAFDAGQHFVDIPLVWVSKNGKFSKMFKCRYCPHVNLRKVNIQEHEKMHSIREKNTNSTRLNDVEHHCTECNYICNNAGVLSSHSKVHQGLYGTVHCLVDPIKTDDEQIRELSKFLNPPPPTTSNNLIDLDYDDTISAENLMIATTNDDTMTDVDDSSNAVLYFCRECPARFLKENEFQIHSKLHGVRLFYKCEYCTYSARQKPHLLAHNKVHSTEYQERTRVLQTMYITSNVQPQIYPIKAASGAGHTNQLVWVIFDNNLDQQQQQHIFTSTASKRNTVNVPISGTELYQQKSEAELLQQQKQQNELLLSSNINKSIDPQFGTLMHGNPKFVYPTYLKNGRKKEKRYKCHKCPSAFEKRDQYKVHLNLHGSKQRYKCDYCDYSVKYYANYVQHLKKHKMNLEANPESLAINDEKLSLSDQQAYNLLQQQQQQRNLLESTNSSRNQSPVIDVVKDDVVEKKLFWCPSCPYTNYRKDAVDNHQKRHINISGTRNNYTCDYCDYSVPQQHFIRDHVKLHFMPNKINQQQIDGYMNCGENFKLISTKINGNDKNVIFEEFGSKIEDTKQFLPPLSAEIIERFNNNNSNSNTNNNDDNNKEEDEDEGDNNNKKQFVNLESGELLVNNNNKCENNNNNNTNSDNDNNKMDES